MKIAKFLVLFFFLFAFTTASFPNVIHAEESEPVLDVSNQEVRAGFNYFIEVATTDDQNIGGLVVGEPTNGVCPKDVVLSTTRMLLSLVWRVGKDASSEQFLVTLGGTAGLDRFKITKYEAAGHDNWYKLSYCPLLEDLSCVEIGYVVKDGVKYLAPNGKPFPIAFRRAHEPRIDYIKMIS